MATIKRPIIKRLKPRAKPSNAVNENLPRSPGLPPSLEPLVKSGADVDGESLANSEEKENE